MTFGANHYVPILKAKQGEKTPISRAAGGSSLESLRCSRSSSAKMARHRLTYPDGIKGWTKAARLISLLHRHP
ncbi:MAG: hypothetical protein R2706_21330 [Acidimicrobiales bacterium]